MKWVWFYITDAASILHVTDVVLAAERESATLQCTVDGNPLTGEHVTWKRAGFPMETRTNFSFKNITSSLTVYNLTQDDMGSFYCVVDNGIGNESSKPAYLVIKRKYRMQCNVQRLFSVSPVARALITHSRFLSLQINRSSIYQSRCRRRQRKLAAQQN